MLLGMFLLPGLVLAASTMSKDGGERAKKADPNGYDIAFIIDNREIAGSPSAKEDVRALTDMLDRHMFVEHIVRLDRPSFALICDIFGGCPNEIGQPWPSLISQIADPGRSRLYVYYLGPGRLEGRQRQFLFEDGPGRARAYAVGWLHKQLENAKPKSALLMMDTSFSPRPMPCASDDPALIDETMKVFQENYARLMEGRTLPTGLAELSATMPAEPSHCDRYELTIDDVERPLFTKFLLKGVVEGLADREPFGDEDGNVELGELAAYAREKIRRAVQFQWGRRQTVWRVGPSNRAIARVRPRARTWKEKKERKVEITKPEPQPSKKPPEKQAEAKARPAPKASTDKEEDKPLARHVCDLGADNEACIAFCAENPDDFRCPFIGVAICQDEPVSDACPCVSNDPRPDCAGSDSWCRWSADTLGGATEMLVNIKGGGPDQTCDWATRDESEIEDGALWDLFAPIGWRLVRPLFRPMIACALNCQGRAGPIAATGDVGDVLIVDTGSAEDMLRLEAATRDRSPGPPEPIEPLPRTAFQDEICDDSLPPYIGLPRWMAGTLAISQVLRFFSNCEAPEKLDRFTQKLPPPVILVKAPPIESLRVIAPPSRGMPPPIELPPLRPRVTAPPPQPPFEPTPNQIRWLQSALILGNHNPGPIDGMIGDKTNAAIRSWREEKGITPLEGALTEAEFIEIIRELGEKFDQVTPGAPRY